MEITEIGKNVIKNELEAIKGLLDRIDNNFVEAVNIIYNCKARVVVTGMGKSGIIAKKIASTFASTGTPAFFMHPAEGVHGDIGMLTKGDVLLIVSNSGETEEVVTLLPIIKRLNIPLVSIIGKSNSTIAKNSDITLDASVTKEACPFNMLPTSSTTTALVLGDAIAIAIINKRGFRKEDFALLHPSGILGKKLLLRVEDIFHTGTLIPKVTEEDNVYDAIIEISGKGFGCTAVEDCKGNLVGIITDGDLRRAMEKYRKSVLSIKVKDIATCNPKTIKKDILAVKALQIMEENKITVLLVVNDCEQLIGLLHMHDLVKSGIA